MRVEDELYAISDKDWKRMQELQKQLEILYNERSCDWDLINLVQANLISIEEKYTVFRNVSAPSENPTKRQTFYFVSYESDGREITEECGDYESALVKARTSGGRVFGIAR